RAVRSWALAHRHEYALIYGSPVPGYHAPEDTVVPASGVALRLAAIAIDADRAVGLAPQAPLPLSEDLRRDAAERAAQALAALGTERAGGLDEIDPSAVIAVIDGWTQLFGTVSFELFGHYERTVEAREDYLDHVATTSGRTVGIPGLSPGPRPQHGARPTGPGGPVGCWGGPAARPPRRPSRPHRPSVARRRRHLRRRQPRCGGARGRDARVVRHRLGPVLAAAHHPGRWPAHRTAGRGSRRARPAHRAD